MVKLHIIIASTRPGRLGLPIGKWFHECAKRHGKFEVELVDLAEITLPFLDEPKHPRLMDYQHEHTKAWSKIVARANAYVFVTPEYNYGMAPALLNALDFVYQEWNYKPAGFVSYGGVSGGTRGVQMAKNILSTLKVVPVMEGVFIPFVAKQIIDGEFDPDPRLEGSCTVMLDELLLWAETLRPLHTRIQDQILKTESSMP
ncbi:MAG: NAD(P)H-dependent oxidoreductase [Armatimonadetes bacterium]|nr:NAD(P)H-dependent oxidoreductase [Armatimonadota bacterium]